MPTAKKADLEAASRISLAATREPALVDVPAGKFLAAEGTGDPSGDAFHAAIGAIYGAAWTLKMTGKREDARRDFKVGALEGLWWGGSPTDSAAKRKRWRWKLLIRVPDFVGAIELRKARATLAASGRAADGVTLERFAEGRAVQVLHVGPYADEPATLARLEAFAREEGLRFEGPHHEVYLSDPTRTAPAKLRTILRHAVRGDGKRSPRPRGATGKGRRR
jgi:hypothetical protein